MIYIAVGWIISAFSLLSFYFFLSDGGLIVETIPFSLFYSLNYPPLNVSFPF